MSFNQVQLSLIQKVADDASLRGLTRTAMFLYDKISISEQDYATVKSSEISNKYKLAKCYFDNQEYERCTHLLENDQSQKIYDSDCKFPEAKFLSLFSRFKSIQKKQRESSLSSSEEIGPTITLKPKIENEITQKYSSLRRDVAKELDIYKQKSSNDTHHEESYLWYLNGILHQILNNRKDATKSLMMSIKFNSCLWASWYELSKVLPLSEPNTVKKVLSAVCPTQHFCKSFFVAKFLCTKKCYETMVDQELIYLKDECSLETSGDYLAAEAEFLHTVQNYTLCIEKFTEMRNRYPYRFEDCDTYSNVLFTSSKRVELASLAHELNEADPFRSEVCIVLGNYYSLRGEHHKSIEFFDRGCRLNPAEKSGVWILLGHEYAEINEPQMAISAYKRAQEVDPNDYRAWYALGQQYELLDMFTASLYYYSKAATLQPLNTVILTALADSMNRCGKSSSAEILMRRCVSISGNVDSSSIEGQTSLYRLGKFYADEGREASAAHYYSLYVRKLEACGSADSDLVMEVYVYLANYFKKDGKYDLAEEYAKDALKSGNTKDEAKKILGEINELKDKL